jgi:hypothetical protein
MRPTCRNELIKAGVSLSDLLLVGVCTMQWLSHYVLGNSHDLLTAAASSERWRMHIQRPRSVPHRSRWPPTRPSGGTQHPDSLAGMVQLRAMPQGAERGRQGTAPEWGAVAAPGRAAAAVPGCHLRPEAVQGGAEWTWA